MDARFVLDSLAKQFLLEMMIASRQVDFGEIEPDELSPDKIADGLDDQLLLKIQKALQFARTQAPAIARRADQKAIELIRVLKQERQLGLVVKNYENQTRLR